MKLGRYAMRDVGCRYHGRQLQSVPLNSVARLLAYNVDCTFDLPGVQSTAHTDLEGRCIGFLNQIAPPLLRLLAIKAL